LTEQAFDQLQWGMNCNQLQEQQSSLRQWGFSSSSFHTFGGFLLCSSNPGHQDRCGEGSQRRQNTKSFASRSGTLEGFGSLQK
jgi:hypothetical protein